MEEIYEKYHRKIENSKIVALLASYKHYAAGLPVSNAHCSMYEKIFFFELYKNVFQISSLASTLNLGEQFVK